MKVHYINILLFAHALNILAHNKNKKSIITRHTQTNRSLCECDLYMPNYDNDSEMKKVLENFNKQTQQRFREYDERMKTTRQKCKERCDKDIQKIILKDKLEKQMAQKFTTLDTNISTEDIPTCICEKSLADKTEKFCITCGANIGGGVTISSGVLGGIGGLAVNAWKDAAIVTATAAAQKAGAAKGLAAGIEAGKNAVIGGLRTHFFIKELGIESLESYFTTEYYFNIENLAKAIYNKVSTECSVGVNGKDAMCKTIRTNLGLFNPKGEQPPPDSSPIVHRLKGLLEEAKGTADYVTETTTKEATEAAIKTSTEAIEATSYNWYTTISYSIIAIEVIVLIMVIIYLILRYRRKKKMKKKMQYIKLLEE